MAYLYLDATFIDARWARTGENVSALVAYGIGTDATDTCSVSTSGVQESEASWASLLAELVERELSGVRLVIATSTPDSWLPRARCCPRHVSSAAPCT